MSLYSDYLNNITNGDIDERHGGTLSTRFKTVADSVKALERKITTYENVINPLYDVYDGGYVQNDARHLLTLLTRSSVDPFTGIVCKVCTSGNGSSINQRIDVANALHYSYGSINNDPAFHDIYQDRYTWFLDISNNLDREIGPRIYIYHPNGELNVTLDTNISPNETDHRVCKISLHSYQSIPRVLFHFYKGDHSGGMSIDIRPSDEITYDKYDSIILNEHRG